jgi:signal transduction histidine kinase
VFSAVLIVRSPWYAFFAWLCFVHAFRFLPGAWRWIACGLVAVFFAMAQTGGYHRPTPSLVVIWALVGCVDVVMVGMFTLLGQKTEEQNRARKGMIAELAEANQRLEDMIAENTGLQAQLLVQAREAGAGDERQRLAREIHDTLAQGLTGIITQLAAAQQSGMDAERERRIGNAERLARDSLAEARRSVQALRPQALEDSRLPEALAGEVDRWSATSGVAAGLETTGEARPLHPEVEVTLLRVAQEALANVAKHAGASRAVVTLSYMGDVVTLDVRDDGAGFAQGSANARPPDPGASPGGSGFGLIAMRQRVQRLAGQLEVESEPGAGTAISASLPAIPLAPERHGSAAGITADATGVDGTHADQETVTA